MDQPSSWTVVSSQSTMPLQCHTGQTEPSFAVSSSQVVLVYSGVDGRLASISTNSTEVAPSRRGGGGCLEDLVL